MAKDLVDKYFNKKYTLVNEYSELSIKRKISKIPYYIEQEINGKDLEGIKYEQIWSDSPLPADTPENAFRVILGDFVSTEEGTGIVHTAPTFGADDAKVAREASPQVPPLLIYDSMLRQYPLQLY